jgi:hypothetical protein
MLWFADWLPSAKWRLDQVTQVFKRPLRPIHNEMSPQACRHTNDIACAGVPD